jgi:branched-subunit amino acid transport protein
MFFLHHHSVAFAARVTLEVLAQNEQLPGGVVAIAVAWRWRMTFATIIAGLLALHFFAWLT